MWHPPWPTLLGTIRGGPLLCPHGLTVEPDHMARATTGQLPRACPFGPRWDKRAAERLATWTSKHRANPTEPVNYHTK